MKRIIKKAGMIIRLALNDFEAAYAGSVLGSVWAVAEPLVTAAVYWFVYTFAFGGGDIGGAPYYLWLIVGLAPWFFVSNGLRMETAAFRDYSYVVRKMCFDKAVLPWVRVLSALLSHLIFMVIVTVAAYMEGFVPSFPCIVATIAGSVVFVYALGRLLALLCCIYKDVGNITSVVLNIGFWLTPVFWDASVISEKIRRMVYINPAAIITEGYRRAFFCDGLPETEQILYFSAVCVVLLAIGTIAEKRMLPVISDRL